MRGINVGSRMIAMADLRRLAGEAGFPDAVTVLQTGNLLLTAALDAETVRTRLEERLGAHFHTPIPVAVRTPEEMAAALAGRPFQPGGGEVVYVGFLVESRDPGLLQNLLADLPASEDRLTPAPQHVYILYRNGVHTSPLSNALLERRLKVGVTSRNLNTVRRLVERAQAERP